MGRKRHIFLSYRSTERDFALRLAADLKNSGINVWMDRLDLKPGDDWRNTIQTAIDDAVGMIAVLSAAYVRSHYCKKELARAERHHYSIVPLLITPLSDRAWPIEVEREQYLDFTEWQNGGAYRVELSRLIDDLKKRFSPSVDFTPDAETCYLNNLIAQLEANDLLPPSQEDSVYTPGNQLAQTIFSSIFANTPQDPSILPILSLLKETPRFLLLGADEKMTLMMLHYTALQTAYARREFQSNVPLPYLLNLAEWGDALSFTEFLYSRWSFETNLDAEISARRLILFLGGMEHLTGNSEKLRQLQQTIQTLPYVVVSCNTSLYGDEPMMNIPAFRLPPVTALPNVKPDLLLQAFSQQQPSLLELVPILSQWLENLPSIAFSSKKIQATLRTLKHLDEAVMTTTLIHLMRGSNWQVRHNASLLLQQTPSETLTDLHKILETEGFLDTDFAEKPNLLPDLLRAACDGEASLRRIVAWLLGNFNDKAAVPALVEMLHDPDPTVIIEALNSLALLGDPDSFSFMLKCLDHRNLTVQEAVSQVALWIGLPIVPVLKLLQPKARINTQLKFIELLKELNDVTTTDLLLQWTYDPHPTIRAAALEALQDRENDAVIKRLLECLGDNAWVKGRKHHVSDTATRILEKRQTQEQPALVPAAKMTKKTARESAERAKDRLQNATANGKFPKKSPPPSPKKQSITHHQNSILESLLNTLHQTKWGEREQAARSLREYAKSQRDNPPDYVTDKLLIALDDPDWLVRWSVVEALAWIRDVSTIGKLSKMLHDPNWTIRAAAINALIEIQDTDATEAILECLSDPYPMVQETAIEALGKLGDARAIPELARILATEKDHMLLRLAAVEALGKIKHPGTLAPLVAALHDPDKNVRWIAIWSLSQVKDETTIDSLIESLKDTDVPFQQTKRICDLAAETLERIGTTKAKSAVTRWRSHQAAIQSPS